jgi:general secretion pathway protein L
LVQAALGGEVPASLGGSGPTPHRVAVIDRAKLDAILAALKAWSIVPDVVTSDAFLVRPEADCAVAVLEGERALVRAGPVLAGEVANDNLPLLLSSWRHDAVNETPISMPTLRLCVPNNEAAGHKAAVEHFVAWAQQQGWRCEYEGLEEPAFLWLCRNWDASPMGSVNLLQGAYRPRKERLRPADRRALLIAATAAFAVSTLLTLAETAYLRMKAEKYQEASEQEYHRLFPAEPRIVNLRAQMEEHLRQESSGQEGLVWLLDRIGAQVGPSWPDGLSVRHMAYDGKSGSLVMEVRAGGMQAVETLHQSLQASGLLKSVDSLAQAGGVATGRFLIGR